VLDAQAGFASGDYMSHRVSSLSGAAVGPEQLSTLLDSVRELITILSPDGLIQFTTQAFSQVLGHRTEAFVGIAFTSLVHPTTPPVFASASAKLRPAQVARPVFVAGCRAKMAAGAGSMLQREITQAILSLRESF